MNSINKNHFQFLLLHVFLFAGVSCKQVPGDTEKDESNSEVPATTATNAPLTMEQTDEDKWVIMDGQKWCFMTCSFTTMVPIMKLMGLFEW